MSGLFIPSHPWIKWRRVIIFWIEGEGDEWREVIIWWVGERSYAPTWSEPVRGRDTGHGQPGKQSKLLNYLMLLLLGMLLLGQDSKHSQLCKNCHWKYLLLLLLTFTSAVLRRKEQFCAQKGFNGYCHSFFPNASTALALDFQKFNRSALKYSCMECHL